MLFSRKLRKEKAVTAISAEQGTVHTVIDFTKKLLVSVVKTTTATAVMIGALMLSQRLIGYKIPSNGFIGTLIGILIYTVIGGIFFIMTAALFKADELMFLFNLAKGFMVKFKNKLAR